MNRYARLLSIQMKASILVGAQYRYDFLVEGVISIFWTVTALVPLLTLFELRSEIAGWTMPEALLVVAWFTLLQAVLEGAINPSLTSVVDHIRKGTLDFILLKPADAQFLVSTSRFLPWRATQVVIAAFLFGYAFQRLGRLPSASGIAAAILLLGSALLVLYSLWILVVSAAFYVVRIDNLSYLFGAIFDAARWPVDVFRGAVRFLFTFIIPLALMTTFPAKALLGRLSPVHLMASIAGALLFAALARAGWMRAMRHYTSASS